jgi:hypothetical protein
MWLQKAKMQAADDRASPARAARGLIVQLSGVGA